MMDVNIIPTHMQISCIVLPSGRFVSKKKGLGATSVVVVISGSLRYTIYYHYCCVSST